MVASSLSFTDPPCPLPPDLCSDIAYRRAHGESWEDVGAAYRYDHHALRRATEADSDFAALQDRAWTEATWEGQADGMRRLRKLANGEDEDKALEASEILVKYAAEQRRNDARLAVEKLRAETKLEVERLRAARHGAKAEPEPAWPRPVFEPMPKTEEDYENLRDRRAKQGIVKDTAEVYIWGGKHALGRCVGPDESDTRVRVKADDSCGCGPRGTVYWVIPDPPPPEAHMPGDPGPVPTLPFE